MRKLSKKICMTVLSAVMAFLFLVSGFGMLLLLRDSACERQARFVPSYERIDLTPLVEKENWTDEDYDTVYHQTGLSRAGADSVPRERLKAFQDAFFFSGELVHEFATPITPHDQLTDPETGYIYAAPIVPLEAGDVIVTSTTHLFGWRHGHAALVINGTLGTLLESVSIGQDSFISHGVRWFQKSANFLVLRMKDKTSEEREKIASDAANELTGLSYNVFLGFFLPKDQCKDGRTPTATHCAHLVWQAFMNAGYDADPTGGPVVSPQDLANSPYFEVVQTYGFDPDVLWN